MKKTPHAYELKLVDLNLRRITTEVLTALKVAALARPRRVRRSPLAKKLTALGFSAHPDGWRDVARRYLRRRLPGLPIYVGGHHIAIHTGKRRANHGPDDLGVCLGRIVEAANA